MSARYPVLPLHDFAAFAADAAEAVPFEPNLAPPPQEVDQVVLEPTPIRNPRKRPSPTQRKAQNQEIESAVKVLEKVTESLQKSNKGEVPRKYNDLLQAVFHFQDSYEDALERRWAWRIKEEEKEAKRKEFEAKRAYMDSIRAEIKKRYEHEVSLNKERSRIKVKNGTMDRIIREVREVMKVPDDIKIDPKHILRESRKRPKGYYSKKKKAARPATASATAATEGETFQTSC